jgi:hypothetical protein
MIRARILVILLIAAGFVPAWRSMAALPARDSLPTLDQLIERHIQALGGQSALANPSVLVLAGECESSNPEESGPFEISIATPKVYYSLGKGALRMGFNGETVWRHTESEGLRQMRNRQFASLVTVFDVARVLWWKESYPEAAVKGIEKLGEREAYVVEMRAGSPGSERLFIDRESLLLVRDEVMPTVFSFSDYRAVDGVQVPFTIVLTTRVNVTYTHRIRSARRVALVDPSRFEPR